MKKVITAVGATLSMGVISAYAEIPQLLQKSFSAPGPAGKVTVQISGECRGKLIYEAQDFNADFYAQPDASGHVYFNADVSSAFSVNGYFNSYSTNDKMSSSIKKGNVNFQANTKNPMNLGSSFLLNYEDLANISCKNGQNMKTYLEQNNGTIYSMPDDNTKFNQRLKISGKAAPYKFQANVKTAHQVMFMPTCAITGDLTNDLQSNFYSASCKQKTKIVIKTNANLKGRATPLSAQ